MAADSDLFDGAVSYDDLLPLAWLPLAKLPKPFDPLRLAEANLRTLSSLAQIEERSHLSEDQNPHDQEIARLHAKLDALINVVSTVLPRFVSLPAAASLHLSWQGIVWTTVEAPPAVGESGYIDLYLHPGLLKALRMPAKIVRVRDSEVRADFDEVPEICREALERHVFQRHRRAVADRRTVTRK
jgi:hypothetical protein